MRNLFIVLLVALTIASCQKNEPEVATLQEVSFEAINIDPGTLKSGDGEFDCPKDNQGNYLVPTVAKVVIDATPEDLVFWPQLFELDGKLYTQAIKLPVDADGVTTYTVEQFGLYTAVNGTLVMATPAANSTFAVYTNPDVTFTFDVKDFEKAQIPVQVLCFIPDQYTSFGFDWFQVTEIIVREQCFFGDLCITNTADFNYTPYNQGGVMPDEEAYIKVVVKRNGTEVPNSPFIDTYGDGKPLCVQYPDYLGAVDNFTFDLYVWVPTTTPGVFDWQLYGTFTATDAAPIAEAGTDGVIDFAIGDCSPNSNPIYTWLPAPQPPCYIYQGFEVNTDGWNNGYGVATRVPSGTNGISSAVGSYNAIFTQDVNYNSGPFTRYCGYVSVWPGNWTATADIYLDPAWAIGQGFDFSVATNGTNGSHRRDFIFHVARQANGDLMVGGSNNSNFNPRMDLANINHYTVSTAGWYTFKHEFRNNGGVLAVDLNLYQGANLLWTETRSDASDLIPSVIGGHRYGWFTFINVAGGIAVDETNLNP